MIELPLKLIEQRISLLSNGKTKVNKRSKTRAEKQEKILKAAREEFISQGYKGASVQSIADKVKLPKANILYYFANKEKLYLEVLEQTLNMWDQEIDHIDINGDPRDAIERFVEGKVRMSFKEPNASKIYALEIIQGSQHLKEYTRTYFRTWVREKAKIFQHWIDQGKMADVDPVKLIFLIWSSTQHYADFESQILTIMNRADYEDSDVIEVTEFLTDFILRGCNLK